jgi:hypothetical protein
MYINLSAGGCSEVFPLLPPHTSLSGVVTFADGTRASKRRVEVLRRNPAGEWDHTNQFWTSTDEKGRLEFKDLPTGEYLVGYDIWSDRPSRSSPYETLYYPGERKRERAAVVKLFPKQNIDEITFRLGSPQTPRPIRVEVVWPDGASPTEHLLQLFDDGELVKNIGFTLPREKPPTHNGVVEFSGYEERVYKLQARYWIDDLGGPAPYGRQRIATSEVVELKPGKGPAVVILVLSNQMLANQQRD